MTPEDKQRAEWIRAGAGVVGIEFGSTRIKAALIGPDATPLAAGAHTWENQLVDGIWTYQMADVSYGLAACFASLGRDVRERYGVSLSSLRALGVSGMMHGYVALDREGALLTPFRTWRNNITGEACHALTPELDFAIPQRWTIAHLYQSILDGQEHVRKIHRLTTLAGYVHLQLTGEFCLGVGEASGVFPIDGEALDWDRERMAKFDRLIAPYELPFQLRDILPRVVPAGKRAGHLSKDGARLLDPTGLLEAGVPLCAPEGDAGTGMVATNAVSPGSGNVSAGTSVFAMIVLDKSLSDVHEEIDIVATPDGRPVAMVHANNGSSDLDAWVGMFARVAEVMGAPASRDELYSRLLPLALHGRPDAGGLLSINYVSGEHITGFSEGRPLLVRDADSEFTLENLLLAMNYSSLCALKAGMDILTQREGVKVQAIRGHGGFFKGGQTGQHLMAAALGVPVSVPESAAEGGAFGMALLAAFLEPGEGGLSLGAFLNERLAAKMGESVAPRPEWEQGFLRFFERHRRGLAIEQEAIRSFG